MARQTRLQRRKESGIYYCRVSVPEALQPLIGKTEIKRSLKTTDASIARHRCMQESIQIERLFLLARGEDRELQLEQQASHSMPTIASPVCNTQLTFSQLVEQFLNFPERQMLAAKTKLEYQATYGALIKVIGANTKLAAIDRNTCREVQQVFMQLPANYTKRFPSHTIKQIIQKAQKQRLQPMSTSSTNKYLTRLSTLFSWAVQEGIMRHNPAQGLQLRHTISAQEKRLPFTPKELQTIFSSEEMQRHKRDNTPEYWIPMLALWTGARLNELCQLHANDIEHIEGIACLVIRAGEGRTLKTSQSERVIPLHPELIRLGILEYAESIKAKGKERLFPTLRYGALGSLSEKFSKGFARYLKQLDVKHEKNCFHSFRHNFRDALREAGIERDITLALGGWKDKSAGTEAIYGKGYSVKRLHEAICKIGYGV